MFNIKQLHIKSENVPYLLVLMALYQHVIIYSLGFITSRINLGVPSLNNIIYFLVFGFLAFLGSSTILKKLAQKKTYDVAILFFFFAFSYLTTLLFTPQVIDAIRDGSSIMNVLFFMLVVYACARIIDDYDKLFRYIKNGAYYSFLYNTITFILKIIRTTGTVDDYDIVFGYNCIFAALVLYKSFIKDKKWYDLVSSLIMMAATLAMGSRGPMLVLVAYIALEYFFRKVLKGTALSKISFVAVAGTVYALVTKYFMLVCEKLYFFFLKMGIESRTLTRMLESTEDMTDSSGRDVLWVNAGKAIQEYKLFGEGIFGDRQFAGGYYIHNIFIEIYVQYGIVLGTFFLAWIILSNLIALIKNKNADILLILTCYVWVYLYLSSSYLMNTAFWILFGLSMNITSTKTKENK